MGDTNFQDKAENQDTDYDFFIKFLALGDSNVGKTSLLFQYTDGVFDPKFTSTIGIDFRQKLIVRENRNPGSLLGSKQRLNIQLWDTAGQERYRSFCTSFLRDAMGFLLVFDLTNEVSLINCRTWMDLLCNHAYCNMPDVVLVGNKCDLADERQVTHLQAKSMANELNVPYIETSAATGSQVTEAFNLLLDGVMAKIDASLLKLHNQGSTVNLNKSTGSGAAYCNC